MKVKVRVKVRVRVAVGLHLRGGSLQVACLMRCRAWACTRMRMRMGCFVGWGACLSLIALCGHRSAVHAVLRGMGCLPLPDCLVWPPQCSACGCGVRPVQRLAAQPCGRACPHSCPETGSSALWACLSPLMSRDWQLSPAGVPVPTLMATLTACRAKYHDLFELSHRYLGWAIIPVLFAHVLL